MQKKVIMAMSGGVDSAVAAARLCDAGYEVIGVTLCLSDHTRESHAKSVAQDALFAGASTAVDDARRVADCLGIAHRVIDARERFRHYVIDYFLDTYAAGMTPNPCIACNRYMKFGTLWQTAQELGADYIATGHYARITQDANGAYHLCKGLDAKKDQSYVLYHLTSALLPHVLLPLGALPKEEVRAMAASYRLPVAQKAESQEICFIPDDDYARFLREARPSCLTAGDIVNRAGDVLGTHHGLPLYTIGQRKGLGIAASHPLFVCGFDRAQNRLIVGGADDAFSRVLIATDVNWLDGTPLAAPCEVEAKIRYGPRTGDAIVTPTETPGAVRVTFAASQRAVTPGQAVVFYRGDEVLGGGTIARAEM